MSGLICTYQIYEKGRAIGVILSLGMYPLPDRNNKIPYLYSQVKKHREAGGMLHRQKKYRHKKRVTEVTLFPFRSPFWT